MDELGDRIQQVLGDPEQMAQIMNLAQSLMGDGDAPSSAPEAPDGALLGKLGALLGRESGSDKQQALMRAMQPYLSEKRQRKMEHAMRLTRMAHLARLALAGWGDGDDA